MSNGRIPPEPRPRFDKNRMTVLFVDINNDLQSQIAEYYAKKMYPKTYQVFSAGPRPDTVDCDLIITMYKHDEDIRRHRSKDYTSEFMPEEDSYDIVIYTHRSVFDEYAADSKWKGRQILADMGAREDFKATDDQELEEEMWEMAMRIKDWVKENMKDPEHLKSLISA